MSAMSLVIMVFISVSYFNRVRFERNIACVFHCSVACIYLTIPPDVISEVILLTLC